MTNSLIIPILDKVGEFGENKDVAREIRTSKIVPALDKGQDIILDFSGVGAVTQSFIHALISQLIRDYGNGVIDRISFQHCNEKVRRIIEIVTDYMQHRD